MIRGCVCPLDDFDGSCMCESLEEEYGSYELYLKHISDERQEMFGIVESALDGESLWPSESHTSLVSIDERSERNVDCRISTNVKPSQTIN